MVSLYSHMDLEFRLLRPKLLGFDLCHVSRLHESQSELVQGTKLAAALSAQCRRRGARELNSPSEDASQSCSHPHTALVPRSDFRLALFSSPASERKFAPLFLLGRWWTVSAKVLSLLCHRPFNGRRGGRTQGLE